MVRIWARVLKDEKIINQTIFEDCAEFNIRNFFEYISSICQTLDISTPVILSKHKIHFSTFNNCVFLPQDFPERVDFDKFVIEEASNY